MWQKIANQLDERYTVVIPDLRGMYLMPFLGEAPGT